jgi:alpha,alpha-trehalase
MADGFSPIERIDGYLPIEDHGLIGDGATAALVGRDGVISWLCVPRFDAPPLFCGLLDRVRGGHFTVAPIGLLAARQRYLGDTGVLVTEMRAETGSVQVTDGLVLRSGADLTEAVAADRRELVRVVRVLEGAVRLRIAVAPRGGAEVERRRGGLRLRCPHHPNLDLQLDATRSLTGLETTLDLEQGDEVHLSLRWGAGLHRYLDLNGTALLAETTQAWQRWSQRIAYAGPQAELVRRSAITLKLLDHFANGAIVAAPTSSLPEAIGGPRNWDYRYVWVRDAAFSVWALRRLGLPDEANGFLAWILDACESDGRPRVLYDVAGGQPDPEWEDPDLEGYRCSPPVRWGNGAVDQRQHDVYGEIVDCAYLWAMAGEIDPVLWNRLCYLIELARRDWDTPDQGIWEVRSPGRCFTYSVALCQVALDRGARMARRLSLPGPWEAWAAEAAKLRDTILRDAWDPAANSLTEQIGGGGLDASLLALPLRRVVPADHPRMVATVEAVVRRLGCGDGLLYRYLPEESPDGLAGEEGAFLLCSFWLVDNLVKQGRREEADILFASLCARANPLGLLPEQIDPGSGAFLGNYPQAFSHIGLISSAVNLAQDVRS